MNTFSMFSWYSDFICLLCFYFFLTDGNNIEEVEATFQDLIFVGGRRRIYDLLQPEAIRLKLSYIGTTRVTFCIVFSHSLAFLTKT